MAFQETQKPKITFTKKEKDLFPPLKKYFNDLGYKVFPEVPCHYGSVDFVAVKEGEHIAVEMKLNFTKGVVRQAHSNTLFFHKSCVAIPTRPKDASENYRRCYELGIGILQVYKGKTIVELAEAKLQKPKEEFDFSTFEENDDDEAGLPFQKGISAAYVVLDRIRKYVRENPTASWGDIYENVQNHYSDKYSLASSMRNWKGFKLENFKKNLK